jgi:hypothetical protein
MVSMETISFLCAGHVQQLEVKVLTQPDDGEV